MHMHIGMVVHMHRDGLAPSEGGSSPSRLTENRHTTSGNTCHHFQRYGLTCNEYDNLRARAAGRCEICKRAETEVPGGRLLIDHSHTPDNPIVRGLLCARCNAVMACHDGTKKWGPSTLPFAERARAYHLNATRA